MNRDYHVGVPITGAEYFPACGLCDLPPWEQCACSSTRSAVDWANTEADESMQLALDWGD